MNILCLIWYHASLLFLVSNRLLSPHLWYPTLQQVIISIAVFGFVQYLNVQDYSRAAKLLFLGFGLVQCIFFSIVIKPGELTELFALSIPMAAVVLYQRLVTHLTVLVVCLAATLTSHALFQDYPLPSIVLAVITLLFVSSFLIVVYLKRLSQEKEALLSVERNKAMADKITIEQQAEALRSLDDFKNHFFVNISHEIRTPLSLITGYAQRLTKTTDDTATAHQAEMIVRQSTTIKHLVDSIIDLSKMDHQPLTLNKTEVNLSRLLRKIHSEFVDSFAQRGIHFQLSLPPEAVLIACDRMLIARAITNLVTNALKFTQPEGTAHLSLRMADELVLKVYNTGMGIPREDQRKVFERFYQVDNDVTRSQGSGIGLSMTKGIVEAHGYTISVESEPHKYASFTISIPRGEVFVQKELQSKQRAVVASVAKPPRKVTALPLPNGKKSILLVEDNAAMREYITSIEALEAYVMLEARHGEEALAILKQQPVDIIVTDYMMPQMNGLELMRQAKGRGHNQPVLVITAQTDPQRKLEMLRIGIDGYLTKPFMEEELLMMIQKSLRYGAAREQFVAEQLRQGERPSASNEMIHFNQRLKEVINQNLTNDQFTIATLCEQLHLTERTLFRRVKELCGCTPAKLITESRLLRAKEYHDQQKYSSTRQLALAVGFKNSTRFAQKFRTRFGVEP